MMETIFRLGPVYHSLEKGTRNMNIKILDSNVRIVAAEMPEGKNGARVCVCYLPSVDVIVINKQAPHLDKLADVIRLYMNLTDQYRHEMAEHTDSKTLKGVLKFADKVMRIRRHLHRQRRS